MRLEEFHKRETDRKYIKMGIKRIQEKILSLEERATRITSSMSGSTGRSNLPSDRVGEAVAEIDKYKKILTDYEGRLIKAQAEEEKRVIEIEDQTVRLALQYKYIDGLSWQRTAKVLGISSGEALIMICKRYLEKMESR